MTKQECLRQCRYYQGEKESPYSVGPLNMFWEWERVYVSNNGSEHIVEAQEEVYENRGGKYFRGIPKALLLTMFGSWGKAIYDIKKSMPEFIKLVELYLEIASDHFPKDKIPNKILLPPAPIVKEVTDRYKGYNVVPNLLGSDSSYDYYTASILDCTPPVVFAYDRLSNNVHQILANDALEKIREFSPEVSFDEEEE